VTRRRSRALAALVVVGVLAVGFGVFVAASPRHRAFYRGDTPVSATPETSATGAARGPLGLTRSAIVATTRAQASVIARDGRLEVPLADPVPWTLPADGTPAGWTLKEFVGQADVELRRTEGRLALRLRSDKSSFLLYRDVIVDLAETPNLTWSWKVMRLPAAGDARTPKKDDQAAQLYVVFPRWPSPVTKSDVIGYLWDTSAPVDSRLTSAKAENVKLIVVESGRQNVGTWRRFERNVLDDYVALFNRKPPRVGKIALMIDSNDTRSDAESFVASLAFTRPR